jgi:transcriptional regulator with XRE-family HTH domain
MIDSIKFGQYLRQLRIHRNLTIRQVEAFSGVSNSYLSQLENGKRGIPSPDILKKLAPAYRVTYEELMAAAGHLPNTESVSKSPFIEAIEKDEDKTILSWFKSLPPEFQNFLRNKDNYAVIGTVCGLRAAGFSSEMIQEWLGFLRNHLTPYVQKYGVKGKATMAVDPDDMTEDEKRVIENLNKKFFSDPKKTGEKS